MAVTANEISRKVLIYLSRNWPDPGKFGEMSEALKIPEKDLSKNMFWLEEHRLLKLSTSLAAGSAFPEIVMARLTSEGEEVAGDGSRLDRRFPIAAVTTESTAPLTYRWALEKLRDKIETLDMDAERRSDLLKAADELLAIDKLDDTLPDR